MSTVPKGRVGLAHNPDGASEYQVASPASEFVVAGGAGGAVVVVVVGGGRGGVVVVVVGGGAVVVVVVGAGAAVVVVVAAGAVVVVVAGAWYATRCDRRFTPSRSDAGCTTDVCAPCTVPAVVTDRDAALTFNNRRGATKSAPQMIAATPRRLPLVLWFRRAPPFSGTQCTRADTRVAGGFWRT
ncbi:MAG: hypothetical protein P4L20_02210 [Acidimicrobiales bacterium]|nr:hypothetical protein [Acidimicrobiales bacterium]